MAVAPVIIEGSASGSLRKATLHKLRKHGANPCARSVFPTTPAPCNLLARLKFTNKEGEEFPDRLFGQGLLESLQAKLGSLLR